MNLAYYSRLFESIINPGMAKPGGTLREWQRFAIDVRGKMMEARKVYDEKQKEINANFKGQRWMDEYAVLKNDYENVKKRAVDTLTKALDSVIESKKLEFKKNSGAPDEESLRLLQALKMREKLTPADVQNVVDKLNGNIQSLSILRDIAEKNNVTFPVGLADPEEFERSLDRTWNYCVDRIREIDSPDKELSYNGTAFYNFPDSGVTDAVFHALDNNALLTAQIEEDATGVYETDPGDGSGEMWAKVTLGDHVMLRTVASQFGVSLADIEAANPGRDLMHIKAGDKILVPSTYFRFESNAKGIYVQPGDVATVPKPKITQPVGPHGEQIGEIVSIADGE